MTPILLAGPALEPLSLDEIRAYLRLETDEDDDLILNFIRAARSAVEQGARRALLAQNWRIRLPRWPREQIVRLPISPILSIDALRCFDANGQAVVLDPTLLRRDGVCLTFDPAKLSADGFSNGLEIDITGGFGTKPTDVPEGLRQAIRLLVSHFYIHRAQALHEERVAHFPPAIAAYVAPWRAMRLA